MGWQRLGLVYAPDGTQPWAQSHAALPTPLHLRDDTFRVYFSTRDADNRSHVGFADVDITDHPRVLHSAETPLLSPGEDGAFDDSGVSIGSLVRVADGWRLYYMGWNLGVRSPWRNAIGVAEAASHGGPFRRAFAGPILDRSPEDPYTLSYPCVLREGDAWRMWYGSNLSAAVGNADMRHTVKHAQSSDGLHWQRDGAPVIAFETPDENAIARPSVLRIGDGYVVAYACRGATYRIELGVSPDGLHWLRLPDAGLAPEATGWDSAMTCYPALLLHRERLWMLYNGDGYGRTGFGLAVWIGPLP